MVACTHRHTNITLTCIQKAIHRVNHRDRSVHAILHYLLDNKCCEGIRYLLSNIKFMRMCVVGLCLCAHDFQFIRFTVLFVFCFFSSLDFKCVRQMTVLQLKNKPEYANRKWPNRFVFHHIPKKAVHWFLVVSTILNVFDDISWIALYSIYDSTQNRTFLTIQMYSRIHVQGMLWVTLEQVQKSIIWMLSSHNFSINLIAPKWQCSQFDNKMFRFALFLRFIRSLIFLPVNEGKKNKQIYAINKCKYQIKSYEHGTEVMRYAKF